MGDLFSVSAGGDFDPSQSSEVCDATFRYPIYSNALTDDGLYAYTSCPHHKEGSITITARGVLGSANYRESPFTAIGRVLVLAPKARQDGRFFASYINQCVVFAVESTGVPQLTAPQVSKYLLAVPPIEEQEAIANAISRSNELITGLEALVAKKRAIKQGAMEELLSGRRRLPKFTLAWQTRSIGEFADCAAGGTPSTLVAEYWNGNVSWMSSGDLHLKRVSSVPGRITNAGLVNSAAKLLPEKCVLVGLAGQGKTRGTVAMNLIPLCTNQSIAAIYPSLSIVPEYLYYNLDARYDELRELSAGDGGRGGLNLRLIKSIAVRLPPLDEQAAIAGVLSDMDAELAVLESRLNKARETKQGMMQDLLTGRVRLV